MHLSSSSRNESRQRNQPSCTIVPQQFRVLYLPLGRTRILRPAEPTGCCNHNLGSAAFANAPPVGKRLPKSKVGSAQAKRCLRAAAKRTLQNFASAPEAEERRWPKLTRSAKEQARS